MYQKYVALREKAGVTDYEVAKNTGVSTATLSNWKAGKYTPKINKLQKIANYFGVPVTELLEDTTESEQYERRR